MAGPRIVIKTLEKKEGTKAAQFAARMIRLSAKADSKRHYSKGLLDDLIRNSKRTILSTPKDPNRYTVLAKRSEEIIGIALGSVMGGVGRVDWIAVAPDYRRRGIGKKLAYEVENQMRTKGCHKITLFISESHIPAIGLYLKWGMVPEGHLKRHEWGNDYIVMSKWLERAAHRPSPASPRRKLT